MSSSYFPSEVATSTDGVVVDEKVYDLVGLGFGPANLAFAGALVEKWEGGEVRTFLSYCLSSLVCERELTNRTVCGIGYPDSRCTLPRTAGEV